MPYIENITLYPIKSLDGVNVRKAKITKKGALHWDRRVALFNQAGRTVNAKKYPAILGIRVGYDLSNLKVNLSTPDGNIANFQLDSELQQIAAFFSDYFGESISIKENMETGFPDDDENSGPTLVSTATYQEVQSWFPELTVGNIRRRFRANIELGGCDTPFWEDHLFSAPGTDKRFRIGEVTFDGKKPCARCTVPTRDPLSGEPDKSFMQTFILRREETLPSFAEQEQFNHFYHLCVNTTIPPSESEKLIQVGDELFFL